MPYFEKTKFQILRYNENSYSIILEFRHNSEFRIIFRTRIPHVFHLPPRSSSITTIGGVSHGGLPGSLSVSRYAYFSLKCYQLWQIAEIREGGKELSALQPCSQFYLLWRIIRAYLLPKAKFPPDTKGHEI